MLPAIYNAVAVSRPDGTRGVGGGRQHLGNNWVRSVAMTTTDGLPRGAAVRDTGAPITVPVGEVTLGRVFDVLGLPIGGKGAVAASVMLPITRSAPAFDQQTPPAGASEPAPRATAPLCPF